MRRSRFSYWLQSPEGKKFMTYCYGIGALLVLIGAILKLTHWLPILWENFLIAAGLAIEVVIFILETLAKQHEDAKKEHEKFTSFYLIFQTYIYHNLKSFIPISLSRSTLSGCQALT